MGWNAAFWLWSAYTKFTTLKFDNQAISNLVYIGCISLVFSGVVLTYLARHAYGYNGYPIIHAIFPSWNIKTLFALGIASAVVGALGFFITLRGWRIGYLVLTFLVLFTLILLGNFTGYAFNHNKMIYNHYKGTEDINDCVNRMALVDWRDLDNQGCPQKYLPSDKCSASLRSTQWENETEPAYPTSDDETSKLLILNANQDQFMNDIMNAATGGCLNTGCCGLQGRLYGADFLNMANAGLIAILAGAVVLVGCAYFWYVNWVDTARSKQVDYVWLGIFGVITVVSVVILATHAINISYVRESLDAAGNHQ